jgi:hypothetical protein
MEKRSFDGRDSERVEVVIDDAPVILEAETLKTVRLVLQRNLNPLKILGPVTGNLYIFRGAGYVLEVDDRDATAFLDRPAQRGCCGGIAYSSPYFSLV